MEKWLQKIELERWSETFYKWVDAKVLVGDTLIQLITILAAFIIGWLASKVLIPRLKSLGERFSWLSHPMIANPLREILLPSVALLLITIGMFVLAKWEQPVGVMKVFANLTAAWVAISFFSAFVKNQVFSKFIIIVAWTIAALNILGWLDPTVEFLEGIAFSTGEVDVSLLTVIKGLLTLGFLLWLAVSVSNVTERYIRNSPSLTPSLQVLLVKLIKIALITIAILSGISAVGIDITALAVFSGAVGVGIGFGLQKIVSNFISGIILLMDRSIKPGDVIEVDDTYGWINKLSGRHVSVITRDGKEHLIPNEDLITQKVINWSYSNKAVRLHVPFGISYKADPHQVRKWVLKDITDVTRILENPSPVCLLKGFGDNSVDMELRVWIEDPSNGVSNVTSELLFKIWDSLQENGVEIPFPQRDVHVNIVESKASEILEKITPDSGKTAAAKN